MRHIEIEGKLIDVDDIVLLEPFSIYRADAGINIYALSITLRNQNKYTKDIEFKSKDDRDSAYDRIKKLLVPPDMF